MTPYVEEDPFESTLYEENSDTNHIQRANTNTVNEYRNVNKIIVMPDISLNVSLNRVGSAGNRFPTILHGSNGLNPIVSREIVQLYVILRML